MYEKLIEPSWPLYLKNSSINAVALRFQKQTSFQGGWPHARCIALRLILPGLPRLLVCRRRFARAAPGKGIRVLVRLRFLVGLSCGLGRDVGLDGAHRDRDMGGFLSCVCLDAKKSGPMPADADVRFPRPFEVAVVRAVDHPVIDGGTRRTVGTRRSDGSGLGGAGRIADMARSVASAATGGRVRMCRERKGVAFAADWSVHRSDIGAKVRSPATERVEVGADVDSTAVGSPAGGRMGSRLASSRAACEPGRDGVGRDSVKDRPLRPAGQGSSTASHMMI